MRLSFNNILYKQYNDSAKNYNAGKNGTKKITYHFNFINFYWNLKLQIKEIVIKFCTSKN